MQLWGWASTNSGSLETQGRVTIQVQGRLLAEFLLPWGRSIFFSIKAFSYLDEALPHYGI